MKTPDRIQYLVAAGAFGLATALLGCSDEAKNTEPTVPPKITVSIPDRPTPFVRPPTIGVVISGVPSFEDPRSTKTGRDRFIFPPGYFNSTRTLQDDSRHPFLDFRIRVVIAADRDTGRLVFDTSIGRKSEQRNRGGWEGAIRDVNFRDPHDLFMQWDSIDYGLPTEEYFFTAVAFDGRRIDNIPVLQPIRTT